MEEVERAITHMESKRGVFHLPSSKPQSKKSYARVYTLCIYELQLVGCFLCVGYSLTLLTKEMAHRVSHLQIWNYSNKKNTG